MSSRFSPPSPLKGRYRRPLLAAALAALLAGSGGAAFATASTDVDPRLVPPVQNYAEQAVPLNGAPAPRAYYDSPLAAGTLTLQDVLEAHKPNPETSNLPSLGATPTSTATAPMLTPPPQASSTSLMMSQGMRAVLQKVGETSTTTPALMRPPSLTGQPVPEQAPVTGQGGPGQPTSLLPPGAAAAASGLPPLPAGVDVSNAPGIKYEPGQEPKNLAATLTGGSGGTISGSAPIPPASPSASITPSSDAASTPSGLPPISAASSEAAAASAASSVNPTQSCDKDVQKWEKSCGDAGYPATYIGKIIGETHSGCADGALHDVWVSNTCAPPDASSAQTPSTDGQCGAASNNQFDDAPVSNLCAQGIASTVSGTGPWSWACSGVNGGQPAACTAGTRVTPINAACGPANGAAVSAAPSMDLCASGDATSVRGNGPWTWSCRGVGTGVTQSCIAPMASVAVTRSVPVEAVVSDEDHGAIAARQSEPAVTSDVVSASAAPTQSSAPRASVTSDRGELCGSAAETLAYEAPDKDLCRAGSASAVNGDGPWTWACTDNEGRSSNCRTLSLSGGDNAAVASPVSAPSSMSASAAPSSSDTSMSPRVSAHNSHSDVDALLAAAGPSASSASSSASSSPATSSPDLACGEAALQSLPQAPTDNLCVNGSAGAVKGSGPWHWTCQSKAHRKINCETPKTFDGRCGPANGAALKSAPFSGLCSTGVPTGIQGTGPWNWTCNGIGGGVNVSCAATVQASTDTTVDGTCGASANTNRSSAPTDGLCATGSPSSVNGQGPWTWSCSGASGGAVSSCSANKVAATQAPGPKVNGLCGEANGVTATAQPSDGLCSSGTAASVVGNGPWNWSCLGENGGMTVSCTAPLEPPAPIDGVCGPASGVPTMARPSSALCSSGITGTVKGRGPWTWTCSGANGGSPSSCVAPLAGKTTGATPSLTSSSPAVADGEPAPALTTPSLQPSSGLVTPRLATAQGAMPALDKKVMPRLTPSKGLSSPPSPTAVPPEAGLDTPGVPSSTPDIGGDGQGVPPPAISSQIVPSSALQETEAERASHIPGNHLTLDPTISTILFTRGSGNIDEQVISTLDKLSAVLGANPDVRITLTSYADNSDTTPRDARRLSLTRALAVRDYLASKGISDSRVDVKAEGANTTSGYIDRVDVKVTD